MDNFLFDDEEGVLNTSNLDEEDFSDHGIVISIGDGVAKVVGLDDVLSGEKVFFDNNVAGIALNLEKDVVGIALFGNDNLVLEGDTVRRSFSVISVPVGEDYLGRVVDSLGNCIDGDIEIETTEDD